MFATEDEAAATNPPYKAARPVTAAEEDAVKLPCSPTCKLAATVEEAVARNPPTESRVKSVVEAEFCTTSAAMLEAAELVAVRSVKMVEVAAVVEVAARVATENAGYVVEPTTRLSPKVSRRTNLPSS